MCLAGRMSRRRVLELIGGLAVATGAGIVISERQLIASPRSVGSEPPRFDQARSFAHLERQCAFGPRVPNTDGHRGCLDYVRSELAVVTDTIDVQSFAVTIRGQELQLRNVVGAIRPDEPRQVLLCAHWDTRPWADRDPDIVNHRTPILGANDGASGVAILLEAARVLAQLRPRGIGFQFVFFDGEDYGPGIEDMFLGSRYFAANLPKVRPEYGILLDMVGDADLGVYQEGNSVARAPEVVERVWTAAAAAGYEASFPRQVAYTVIDDHIPLLDAGWSVIDVIDFRYPHWHTVGDTPDKCSAESLKAVGETVLKAVLTT